MRLCLQFCNKHAQVALASIENSMVVAMTVLYSKWTAEHMHALYLMPV